MQKGFLLDLLPKTPELLQRLVINLSAEMWRLMQRNHSWHMRFIGTKGDARCRDCSETPFQ